MIKIFVSMGFKGKSEEDVRNILSKLKRAYCRMYPEKDESEIELKCNYWYEAPKTGSKKIHEMAHALELMAECDRFCLVVGKNYHLPKGCKIEKRIWEQTYEENINDRFYEGLYPLD